MKSRAISTYGLVCPDLDQLPDNDSMSIIDEYTRDLRRIDEASFLRVWNLHDGIFVNSDEENLKMGRCLLNREENFFSTFFGARDFFSSVIFEKDYALYNSNYLGLISLSKFPKFVEFGELMSFGEYVAHFKKVPHQKAKMFLDDARKRNSSAELDTRRNFEGEASLDEANKVMEMIVAGEEDLFEVEVFFLVRASTESEFRSIQRKLVTDLDRRNYMPLIENVGLEKAFISIFEDKSPLFERSHEFYSGLAVNILPFTEDSFMDSGFELHSRSWRPVKFKVFNEKSLSYSVMVTAATGAGKGVAVLKILKESIEEGARIFIFDPKGDFKKFICYFDGEILERSFNPLQFKDPAYLTEVIVSVVPEKELTALLKGKLLRKLKSIDLHSINYFPDLLAIIEQEFPDIPYYFEELLPYFDDQKIENINLAAIHLENFPDIVLGPLLIFLVQYLDSIEGKKILVLDECHRILAKNANWIGQKIRELRSKMGSVITLTQAFEDFIGSDIGRVIAKNSFYKVFLAQQASTNEFLDSFDVENINSLRTIKGDYSELYIKTDFNRKVLRYAPTPLEYELFSSDYMEKQEFLRFFDENEKYFDFRTVMDRWVHFKYFLGDV